MAHWAPASYQVLPVEVSAPSRRASTVTIMARSMGALGEKAVALVPLNSSRLLAKATASAPQKVARHVGRRSCCCPPASPSLRRRG